MTCSLRNVVLAPLVLVVALPIAALGAPKTHPSFKPIEDNPNLPRVLLIGDSISMGYTFPTQKLLEGKANVHRIGMNGGPTTRGLQHIDEWLGKGRWDLIHFNWGLHDMYRDGKRHRVPIEQYEKNLRTLVERLEKTGARLIWASTTPVPEGAKGRQRGDEVKYNAAAQRVMDEHKIEINDLYGSVLSDLGKLQNKADVHFNPAGSEALAREVAARIERALGANPPRGAGGSEGGE